MYAGAYTVFVELGTGAKKVSPEMTWSDLAAPILPRRDIVILVTPLRGDDAIWRPVGQLGGLLRQMLFYLATGVTHEEGMASPYV